MKPSRLPLLILSTCVAASGFARGDDRAPVSFNRDVRPILSDHCFRCHGPDAGARKADLRLDKKEEALRPAKSGERAIVPGDVEASELLHRLVEDDPTRRMPPRSIMKPLDAAKVDTLKRWIAQGAVWEDHWSSIPPKRPSVPKVDGIKSPVDRFIAKSLAEKGIQPSPEADRVTLIRRLSYDLTGLPPTVAEVDAFVADKRSDAYSRLVDRLLASPHYGEKAAQYWLDLVRYADTVGYHSDVDRSVWLYRDYVIKSFNDNLPFDRFTVEQLAGDLLPDAGTWTKIASAYNMLGMTTEEGGAQPKEYLTKYSADRVRNFGSVWLGATLGCAECHDHKYDPYTTRDFYSLAAFFADIRQDGVGTPKPTLFLETPEQAAQRKKLDAEITRLQKEKADKKTIAAAQAKKAAFEKEIPATVVSVSGEPRVIRIIPRGDWLDESGEVVSPAVPRAMNPGPIPKDRRPTRLDLARWLIDPDHPLTARVFVNRMWKQFFGAGLSDSLEDLGSQGEWPTHPELLDWLAVEFRESGWNVKDLIRLLVNSETYKRTSAVREDLALVDPLNRLLARQNAFRKDAEAIRDEALFSAEMLNAKVGGPSVKPYQPAGYWRFLNFPTRDYVASKGDLQYRRGLYTHWQRTLLHPAMLAFDAPSRENCTAGRPRSNTPQAALALLNDPSQVEAARGLAEVVLTPKDHDDEARLTDLWRRVLSRRPEPAELSILGSLLKKHRESFKADPKSAAALLNVGQNQADPKLDPIELAAWTSAARALLNLDETITRE